MQNFENPLKPKYALHVTTKHLAVNIIIYFYFHPGIKSVALGYIYKNVHRSLVIIQLKYKTRRMNLFLFHLLTLIWVLRNSSWVLAYGGDGGRGANVVTSLLEGLKRDESYRQATAFKLFAFEPYL